MPAICCWVFEKTIYLPFFGLETVILRIVMLSVSLINFFLVCLFVCLFACQRKRSCLMFVATEFRNLHLLGALIQSFVSQIHGDVKIIKKQIKLVESVYIKHGRTLVRSTHLAFFLHQSLVMWKNLEENKYTESILKHMCVIGKFFSSWGWSPMGRWLQRKTTGYVLYLKISSLNENFN